MAAAKTFVGCAEGLRDLANHLDVLCTDRCPTGAGAERPGGGVVIVAERHGDTGSGEGGDSQKLSALDIGSPQVSRGDDRIGIIRERAIWVMQPDLHQRDDPPRTAAKCLL